jgi:CrcB protein
MTKHSAFLYLAAGAGAAIGGMARFWMSGVAATLISETFPWGTYLVNVIGSTFIGFFATLTAPDGRLFLPASTRIFVMVGLCGGFTTFSTFSLETLNLARDGQMWRALLNIAGTLASCLIGVWCGYLIATGVNQR